MKYDIKILPAAWEDLKKVEDYYCIEFSVDSALKVGNSKLDAVERLKDHPDSGSLLPDKWLNEQGYRMVICGKYIAVYRKINSSIYVYHIANTQTDYTKLFYK